MRPKVKSIGERDFRYSWNRWSKVLLYIHYKDPVPLNEGRFSGSAIANKNQLELGHILVIGRHVLHLYSRCLRLG